MNEDIGIHVLFTCSWVMSDLCNMGWKNGFGSLESCNVKAVLVILTKCIPLSDWIMLVISETCWIPITPVVTTVHLWSDHLRGLLMPDVNALILAWCSFPSVLIIREYSVEKNSSRLCALAIPKYVNAWTAKQLLLHLFLHAVTTFPSNFKMLNDGKILKEMKMRDS